MAQRDSDPILRKVVLREALNTFVEKLRGERGFVPYWPADERRQWRRIYRAARLVQKGLDSPTDE